MDNALLAKRFGKVLKRLRVAKGLSQEALATSAGLHRTYIGNIERGEKTITIGTASKLARALGLSLTDLFSELEGQQGSRKPRSSAAR